jgi:iron complex transport system permease protein
MAAGAAASSTVLMLVLTAAAKRVNGVTLLILRLMLGFLCLGLISVRLHFADEGQTKVIQHWDNGSFSGAPAGQAAQRSAEGQSLSVVGTAKRFR